MQFAAFSTLLSREKAPVILLEGTRDMTEPQARDLTALAAFLARAFPHARFRTGNARGSDEAFAAGVGAVDVSRLDYILPYATHRRSHRPADAVTASIGELPPADLARVVETTLQVSPQYRRPAVNYRDQKAGQRERAIAQMILRDTLKVTGAGHLPPPVAGIFQMNAGDPERGGTGHTMRVCRHLGVPVITQFDWLGWPFMPAARG